MSDINDLIYHNTAIAYHRGSADEQLRVIRIIKDSNINQKVADQLILKILVDQKKNYENVVQKV